MRSKASQAISSGNNKSGNNCSDDNRRGNNRSDNNGGDNKSKEFEIKFCKTKGALSVRCAKIKRLDLAKVKKEFISSLVLDTPIMIIIKCENPADGEIIVKNFGELVFKDLRDKEEIEKISGRIFQIGA